MRTVYLGIIAVGLSVAIASASWQNPTFLGELNDYEHTFAASPSGISSDDNCILFLRSTPAIKDALWEARRNPETGLFDQQRQLSELKNGGSQVYGTWLSQDKLRLYYAAPDPKNLGWSRRPIWLAAREDLNAPWKLVRRLSELEVEPFPNDCTLTADEKCIMYEAASWIGGGMRRIFTASRPSPDDTFSNIREAVELEEMGAWRPHMSSDGRTVYFRILIGQDQWEVWSGHRRTLEEPFGGFTPIEELNAQGVAWDLFPSWDGMRLYYRHWPSEGASIFNAGVYVSEWVYESFADALALLQEAAADKEHAARLVQEASDKERTAVSILSTLSPDEIPAGLSKKDLQKSILLMHAALQKQQIVEQFLWLNLRQLNAALGLLLPPMPAPQP